MQGECHVTTKADIRVIHLQAKEHLKLLVSHKKLGKKNGIDSPFQTIQKTQSTP